MYLTHLTQSKQVQQQMAEARKNYQGKVTKCPPQASGKHPKTPVLMPDELTQLRMKYLGKP